MQQSEGKVQCSRYYIAEMATAVFRLAKNDISWTETKGS